jgi:phosphotransferase system HPr (HPr) family protein
MITRSVQIVNEFGIHCRPSCLIAKAAAGLTCRVTVRTSAGAEADAARVLDLLGLGLGPGDCAEIVCEGPGEEAAADQMAELLTRQYDFKR